MTKIIVAVVEPHVKTEAGAASLAFRSTRLSAIWRQECEPEPKAELAAWTLRPVAAPERSPTDQVARVNPTPCSEVCFAVQVTAAPPEVDTQ